MGAKFFCDKCDKEIDKNGSAILINAYDGLGNVLLSGIGRKFLCEECTKKFDMIRDRLEHAEDFFDMTDDDISLMEYDFKVGDMVITDIGEVGFIESICDCDKCKARGFYEPRVKKIDDDETIYITDTDKSNDFANFYQIGKYRFGNLDKEFVERNVKYANKDVEEAIKRFENCKKQLHHLILLEKLEKENKEFALNVDENGYLYSFNFDIDI